MTRRPLALLCFGLIACGPSQAASSPSAGPSTAAPTAQTSPSSSINPGPDLPVTAVDFSCRLPVVTSVGQTGGGITLQGGFISFPSAQIQEDPAGTMHSGDQDFTTNATPVLHGNGFVPFYDRAQSRWVPAPARQALADGSGYAYPTWNPQTGVSTAHVVNAASGSTRSFDLSLPWNPDVADFRAEGAYLLASSALGGPGGGVWLLDPVTGTVKQLRQIQGVWAGRDGYAWVARFDSRDKTVWLPSELAPANSLVRIDLATGAETIWFYRAGSYPWFLGLDSLDRPVVTLGGSQGNEVLFVDRAGSSGQMVYSGTTPLDFLQGDGGRLGFGANAGIYLYTPGGGFQKVFTYNAVPGTSDRIEPAGFCR